MYEEEQTKSHISSIDCRIFILFSLWSRNCRTWRGDEEKDSHHPINSSHPKKAPYRVTCWVFLIPKQGSVVGAESEEAYALPL